MYYLVFLEREVPQKLPYMTTFYCPVIGGLHFHEKSIELESVDENEAILQANELIKDIREKSKYSCKLIDQETNRIAALPEELRLEENRKRQDIWYQAIKFRLIKAESIPLG